MLFLGIFVAQPEVTAPVIRSFSEPNTPSLFPLLFVTIACGAISGFHGLVASGTSSKQLEYLPDSRMVGYGGMIGEGTLALVSTIAAVAGISLVGQAHLPSVGFVADLDWSSYYDSWEHASQNKAAAFVLGGGALIKSLGIPESFANTLMAVLVISFAATTLDTATRIQRFILNEFGKASKIHFLSNRFLAIIIAGATATIVARNLFERKCILNASSANINGFNHILLAKKKTYSSSFYTNDHCYAYCIISASCQCAHFFWE